MFKMRLSPISNQQQIGTNRRMAWQIGDKLKDGKYTIEQVLGHGGFGQTYVAVRNANNAAKNERVVLKHLKKEDGEDDTTFRDRQTAFTNEAIRLASCEHPHIVKVRPETFWEEDLVHMVMEHIEGENLEILLKQRQQPFSLDEALRYIAQIASALEHIHNFEPPLIHRDVKPANIVLRSRKTEAILVDFGSAKEVRAGASLSLKSIYTAGYSAIEIYSGIKKDTYTDVYSLGATLYFLLTTTIPTPVQQRVVEDLVAPIQINTHISQRINDAIMAAMEIKPKDRVQTVTEFMQRLGQPLKPSIIHQGLGLFGAKVAPSNPQADKKIAEQSAKIAAAEKQAKLERQRRQQAEREAQEAKMQLQELAAEKQSLAREQQKAESERQQRQRAEREAQAVREQLQQSEAEKQRLADELQRATAEKERQARAARDAQIKADQERQAARDAQVRAEQAKREQAEREQRGQLQKQQKIELRSAKGIDYGELEKLLKNQEWRKADELTAKLMCQVANREKEGWLDTEHIEAFPCEDLRTIDQLWVHYSNSKFGFSIQKKLWLECGGEIGKYDYEVWKKFAAKVGWYHPQKNDWRTYTEFMNDTKNAQNALPASLPCSGWVRGRSCRRGCAFVGGLCGLLFSRAETCEL